MPEPSDLELVLAFTRRLAAAGIEYMVTGSVACIAYGEPRTTHDVDVVARFDKPSDPESVERAFPIEHFYVPPAEVLRVEASRGLRGHFNIIEHDSGYKADIYLAGRDPLHAWAFARRRRIPVGADEIVVAPPEYVIVRKLEFFREGGSEKHLNDIAGILRVSGDKVDTAEVARMAGERGLGAAWNEAQRRC